MTIIVCRIELYIPAAQSLKDKRQVVQSLIGRVRARLNCSAAEVDYQDLWQRSAVGVAMIGTDKTVLDGQLSLLRRLADGAEDAEIVAFDVDYY